MATRHGFTLLELLIVIGVIAVLVALLVPALSNARDQARSVKCQSNQRQLAIATISFAVDHAGRMPGIAGYNAENVPRHQLSWVGSTDSYDTQDLLRAAPQNGTLWDYVQTEGVYRCPSLEPAPPGSGAGSNGKFDYALMSPFGGALYERLPTEAMIDNDVFAAPMFVEEHPRFTINYTAIEGTHSLSDKLGDWHPRESGNYVAIDGSLHRLLTAGDEPRQAWDWWALPPSGGKFGYEHQVHYLQAGDFAGYSNLGFNLRSGPGGTGWADWDYR